jgi:hypothetical protein
VEDRVGGSNQRAQTKTWVTSLPLSRSGRHATMGGLGVIADNIIRWGAILRDRAPRPVQSTRLARENGHAQNYHRRPYPLRVMSQGLCQKAHFCDGK